MTVSAEVAAAPALATTWFQGLLGPGLGWFVAILVYILLIALPLMLAVAMIIYADRKIWAAMALRRPELGS